MTNDWVKTADVKAAVLLTAAGVVAGVLYNLTSGGDAMPAGGAQPATTGLATTALWTAAACSVFVLAAAVCAATALVPSLTPGIGRRSRGGPPGEPNLLYFGDVDEHYSDPHGQRRHAAEVLGLFDDPPKMAGAVAQQLHVNALIAARKHRWVQRGLRSLLVGLVLLAGTALLRVLLAT